MNSIHQRLTAERHRLGLTQQEAANSLGVGRSAYAHYESGRANPDVSLLEKAQNMGMDAWWVATGIPFSKLAIDLVNLDALRSVVMSVADFNKQHHLNLTPEQQNELIRSLYCQFVDLKEESKEALPKLLSKAAA